MNRLALIAATVALPLGRTTAQQAPARVALVGATLIDDTGAAPVTNAIVLVEGARILAAGTRQSVALPAGTTVIDVAGKYVLPGFIDLHMHLTCPLRQDLEALQTDSEATLRAVFNIEMFPRLGITSVRDVAAPIALIKAAAAALGDGNS